MSKERAEIPMWHPILLFHPRHPMSCIPHIKLYTHARKNLSTSINAHNQLVLFRPPITPLNSLQAFWHPLDQLVDVITQERSKSSDPLFHLLLPRHRSSAAIRSPLDLGIRDELTSAVALGNASRKWGRLWQVGSIVDDGLAKRSGTIRHRGDAEGGLGSTR